MHRDLDPELVELSYQALRSALADGHEPSRRDRIADELAAEWQQRHPVGFDRQVIHQLAKMIGVSPGELNTHSQEEVEAYEQHRAAVRRRMEEEPWLGDWPSGAPELEDLDPDIRRPALHSVIGLSSDARALRESFDEGVVHNPFAELKKPAANNQKLWLWAEGDGNGFYDCLLVPELLAYKMDQRIWFFLYVPGPSVAHWSCSAKVHCHGEIECHAAGSWANYRHAAVKVSVAAAVLPVDAPITKAPATPGELFTPSQDVTMGCSTILDYGGDSIHKDLWGGWLGNVALVEPRPWHRHKPHWILVRVMGQAFWRGYSHVKINFAKGYSSSGSKEGGTYTTHPYQIYCYDVPVYEMIQAKQVWE